ncbi:MAG TPA: helicase-related protein [Ktedonosporobacter sp.]|jgi:superfamily II DNA or RNA helicase|nr:helicase-related protein [Ktedonosporobacter sp.]
MNFTVGSLVKARGREWVVLPESDDQVLVLRPLGGSEQEVTGIYRGLEEVEAASFALPDPQALGDYRSCRLLRDAVRLGFRTSAGPFRSFSHIGVEPRPYQFVPLLLALKLDPVRLLIADDVGIGKTVEACLIGRELLDRGEIERMAVLCPPHLAEQWQVELREKFHIEAVLVLASTATQLQRTCRFDESIFERYPFVIVSTDFIKADRRRDEFLRTCPEFVIVDEAHTCTDAGAGRGRQQRYDLVASLAAHAERHLVLVTATPHSGNEAAFRSLLSLLKPEFAALPEDLTGQQHERERRTLAAHFVQRRRADITAYLHTNTPFPDRKESEQHYTLTPAYRRLFERVLHYARETISDPADGNRHRQRVRWWSALALLRSLASSPAAAAATLRNRASTADTSDEAEADRIGRHTVMDLLDNESSEGVDIVPGSDYEEQQAGESSLRKRLQAMAREAEALKGAQDAKLLQAVKIVNDLLKDGFQPILFCRFIPTAEYVAQELSTRLPKDIQVEAVTGLLPPVERENRILQLAEQPRRVLVCTDCLSEGINLQEHFNAVIHYDLSWNPTRHEQREGRVDRYGQASPQVRVVTYYGHDNPVDGIVLEVLIKKHHTIRTSLGISVPVPVNSEQVLEAILEGALLRGHSSSPSSLQMTLPGLEDPREEQFWLQWEANAAREKRSRTMFAQESIKPDEVAAELAAMRSAMGSAIDVEHFIRDALSEYGAAVSPLNNGALQVDYSTMRGPQPAQSVHEARGLKETLQAVLRHDQKDRRFRARFELPVREGELYLSRTHPLVESVAAYVMDAALDSTTGSESIAKRCGVMRTSQVERRTTLLLLRLRYHIVTTQRGQAERTLLAEDCQVLAFQGSPMSARWLDDKTLVERLLEARPDGNIYEDQARQFLCQLLAEIEHVQPYLTEIAEQRAQELATAHRRVRQAAQARGLQYRVEPQMPVDILGIYLYLPKIASTPQGKSEAPSYRPDYEHERPRSARS